MKGKLIVLDGVDSSGKQTQAQLLAKRLKEEGYKVKEISFPDYESNSSALVKMYLSGALGDNPDEIDPYAVSSFYAADRYVSYLTKWKKDLEEGAIIIADRYVSSNMIHQGAKIKNKEEKDAFLSWLHDFEFGIYKLPEPAMTIFLDMPVEFAMKLMAERKNKFTGETQKDIHEKHAGYLQESYDNAMGIAKKYDWNIIHCVENSHIKSISEISDEVFEIVKGVVEC